MGRKRRTDPQHHNRQSGLSGVKAIRTARGQHGFSLIELMLALTLGLIVTTGIVQLFVGNNQTYTLLHGQSRLQESARYALDFIGRSARAAGYFGCDPEDGKVYNTLNGTWEQVFEFNITVPVEAFNYSGDGVATSVNDWTPALTDVPRVGGPMTFAATGIELDEVVAGTDILVLRHIDVPGERIDSIVQHTEDPVIEDDGDNSIGVNDFVVISNCEQAALFRATAIGVDGTVVRGTGPGIYENAIGETLSEDGISYGSAISGQATTVSRVLSDIYFIADSETQNNRGDTPRSLWRKSGIDAPIELVQGVRDLQVKFGIDNTPTDDISAPNRYSDFEDINVDDEVLTMRVEVTASTVDVVTEGDQPITRTFSQTVSMRNAS
jgi:type IV pilus assembly protein PilW